MTLSTNTVRHIATVIFPTLITGVPILPEETAVPVDGEALLSSRALGWGATTTVSPLYTWVATVESANMAAIIYQRTNAVTAACYYYFDLTSSAPAAITATGHRPRNPVGGVARYTVSIGTATLKDGAISMTTAAANVEHEPVLSGNTLVDCSKLPPLCNVNGTTTIVHSLGGVYNQQLFITWNPALPPFPTVPTWKCYRWLGGAIVVSNASGVSVDVYIILIDPGTLIGNTSAEVNLGTVANGATTTFSAAILGATLTRWGHYWIYVKRTVPGANIGGVTISLLSPTDVPPTYDAPGGDGVVPGGYLT